MREPGADLPGTQVIIHCEPTDGYYLQIAAAGQRSSAMRIGRFVVFRSEIQTLDSHFHWSNK